MQGQTDDQDTESESLSVSWNEELRNNDKKDEDEDDHDDHDNGGNDDEEEKDEEDGRSWVSFSTPQPGEDQSLLDRRLRSLRQPPQGEKKSLRILR